MPAATIIVRKSSFNARAADPNRLVEDVIAFVAAIRGDAAISNRRTPRKALDLCYADRYRTEVLRGGHSRYVFGTKLTAEKSWRGVERALEGMGALGHRRIFDEMTGWAAAHPSEANAQTGLPGGCAPALEALDQAFVELEQDDKLRRRAARWIAGWSGLKVVNDADHAAAIEAVAAAARAEAHDGADAGTAGGGGRSDDPHESFVIEPKPGPARYEWPEIGRAPPTPLPPHAEIGAIAAWLDNPAYLALEDLRAQAPRPSAPRITGGAHIVEDRAQPRPTYLLRLNSGDYYVTADDEIWSLRAPCYAAVDRAGARRPRDAAPWARPQDLQTGPGAVLAKTSIARAERLARFAAESRSAAAIHLLAQKLGFPNIESVAPAQFQERPLDNSTVRWVVIARDAASEASQIRLIDVTVAAARASVDLIGEAGDWRDNAAFEAQVERREMEAHWRAQLATAA